MDKVTEAAVLYAAALGTIKYGQPDDDKRVREYLMAEYGKVIGAMTKDEELRWLRIK